jgi:hypothetical protein
MEVAEPEVLRRRRVVSHEARTRDRDPDLVLRHPGLPRGPPVQAGERGEAGGLSADDAVGDGQPQQPGAHGGLRIAARSQPDRKPAPVRPGNDHGPVEGRAVPARPGHGAGLVDGQQQVELFRVELVIVVEAVPEERERLGGGAPAGRDFRPPVGHGVERRELLVDPDRIRGAQDRDRAGKGDALRDRGRRRQDDRGRRCGHLDGVVLADAEVIEADLVRQPDGLEQVAHRIRRRTQPTGPRIPWRVAEAVDPKFHCRSSPV